MTIARGGVMLTINPLSDDDLRQSTNTVYGTVSDSSYDADSISSHFFLACRARFAS